MKAQENVPVISVVIAAYNEEDNVEPLTRRIDQTFTKLKIPYEIIYVIEGTDQTVSRVQQLQKKYPIRYFYTEKPQGLANASKKGFMAVSPKTKYILTMDADLNHHPEEIPLFLQEAKEHNTDIIIGSRGVHGASTANIPKWKMLVSNIANQTFKLITSIPVVDKTAGYKLYKREVIQHIAPYIKSRNFEFQVEILLLAKKFGYTMSEVPITFTYRIHGKSKMSLIKTAYGCFVLLLKVLFRRTQ